MYADSSPGGGGGGRRRRSSGASRGGFSSGAGAGGRYGGSSGGRSSGGGGYTAPTYHPSPQPVYNPSRSYSPTSTSSGHYSGGGAPSAPPSGGNSGPVQRTQPPARPAPPTLKKYLTGDEAYQSTRNELIRNFNSLKLTNRRNRRSVSSDYATTKSRLTQDKERAGKEMEADFAARGLLGTGAYSEKLSDFERNYQNQFNDALTSKNRNIRQLLTDLGDSKRLRNSSLRQARLEAIRRRAEKYGLKGA